VLILITVGNAKVTPYLIHEYTLCVHRLDTWSSPCHGPVHVSYRTKTSEKINRAHTEESNICDEQSALERFSERVVSFVVEVCA